MRRTDYLGENRQVRLGFAACTAVAAEQGIRFPQKVAWVAHRGTACGLRFGEVDMVHLVAAFLVETPTLPRTLAIFAFPTNNFHESFESAESRRGIERQIHDELVVPGIVRTLHDQHR